MSDAVLDFFAWAAVNLPAFFMSHPIIDLLAVAVGIWVIALVAHLLRLRF